MLYALTNEKEKCMLHLILIGCLAYPVAIRHLFFHTQLTMHAPPDGYTFRLSTPSTH